MPAEKAPEGDAPSKKKVAIVDVTAAEGATTQGGAAEGDLDALD